MMFTMSLKRSTVNSIRVVICIFMIISCNEKRPNGKLSLKLPEISFESTEYDFGELAINETEDFSFFFTNSSDVPLVVYDVTTTCGCLVSDWTKEPLVIGDKGFISVKLAPSVLGDFKKVLTVHNNANDVMYLKIRGVIIPES